MRHRWRPAVAPLMIVCVLLLSGCGVAAGGAREGRNAVLLIPGTTGDGGFFDQATQGLRTGAKRSGWTPRVIETGYEPVKWQPALEDLAGGNDDLVVTGSFAMLDLVEQAAAQYPNKQFVLFDAAADRKRCGGCDNIYSITYRYDETGFLAGALAGLLERTKGIDRIERTGTVGVVGGQDIPVIDEYIRGFKAGVKATAPHVKVLSAYAGSFADPVKGKAVASDMIQQGAEVVFTAAGATDKGVIEAAAAHGVWALGNAAQQAEHPKVRGKDTVLTASDTNIVTSIADAVNAADRGRLPVGTTRTYGVKEGAVQLTDSALYRRVVPVSVRSQLTDVQKDVAAGKYDDVITARD